MSSRGVTMPVDPTGLSLAEMRQSRLVLNKHRIMDQLKGVAAMTANLEMRPTGEQELAGWSESSTTQKTRSNG